MDLNNIACKKIREIRLKKNISQTELAKKILIERSTYNKIETGKTELTLRTLEKIATSLETDVQDLLKMKDANIVESFNNTGTFSAQGINTTLNLHIPKEALEEIGKLFSKK